MELKNIYRGNEFKFAALFRALQPALLAEFLHAHPGFFSNNILDGVAEYPIQSPGISIEQRKLWGVVGIKTHSATTGPIGTTAADALETMIKKHKAKYPIAYGMTQAFGNHCSAAGYFIAEPGAIIYRHTDVRARQLRSANIHIPLYIPKGDLGFEVEGEISTWDDVFAFDNQKLHSVWNNTSERRLIFILQLSQACCGIDWAPWTPGCNAHVPVFEKTRDPSYNPIN